MTNYISSQNDEEFDKTIPRILNTHVRTKKISSGFDAQELEEQEPFLLQQAGHPRRVSLTILDADIQIVFDITGSVALGRSYPSTDIFNGIDLSPFNAYEQGVSRNHATILLRDNQVIIRDNESENGTLLNNKMLKPNTNYILHRGDRVNLGAMSLRFDLLYNSFERQEGHVNNQTVSSG